ncbi:MAG: xylulokinase [Defluviitaleaceae bacterium]|nr:xylulokinase [Defluviitaleaceae bacterium]
MYVLGLDLGTSSTKGLLLDEKGNVVATKSADYPILTPAPGYSEQDPSLWCSAAMTVMKEMAKEVSDFTEQLKGISFSGQMHSLVLLDRDKKPLRNSILWNDVRTTKQCETIVKKFPKIIDVTKNKALEGFTLPKILWVQENEPEIWKKTYHILLPKDYLRFFLTGTLHMDYSDAAGTLMLDVLEKNWSRDIAYAFNIPLPSLPALISSSGYVGNLLPAIKNEIGFKTDVPVFAGGADNACAAVGAGIVQTGKGMISIGTSGVFLAYEEKGKGYDGHIHYFNHAAENAYYSMGVTLSAGHSLSWFKDNFAPEESYDSLLQGLEDIPSTLFFSPYIVGERTPHTDSRIRGSFIGVDTTHTKKHFTKAVLEGITFSLKDCASLMEWLGKSFDSIVSVGGGTRNKMWLQMQADIFNTPIVTLKTEQGPGFGAAMLAAVGAGWFTNATECAAAFVEYGQQYEPIPENVEKYKKLYQAYKGIYEATKDICHSI